MTSLIIRFFLLIFLVAAIDVNANPVAYQGVISVDSVKAMPGESFSVSIRLIDNDIDIAGLMVPIRVDNPDLKFDSVSFEGTIKPADMFGAAFDDTFSNTLRVSYLPDISTFPLKTISTSGGVLANIWFTLSEQAQPGTIAIDSVNEVIQLGENGQFWTRIVINDSTGSNFFLPGFIPGEIQVFVPTDVDDDQLNSLPSQFELSQNYPNPFNPSTVIKYSLPRSGHIELTIFNLIGQAVSELVNETKEAGNHQITFDASNLPSGVYFYRLTFDGGKETKKMMLVK